MIVIDLNDYPEEINCQTIARRLLQAGHSEDRQLAFVRGNTPIFQSFDTIGYFANHKAVESHNGNPMMHVHDPYILREEQPNGTKQTETV